ncbi:hypothetical protein K7432_009165 [Basidiobolus ranarum]|uniref:BD-FAE-like domain-containing protein n=1 Tax=Basidiobolus ranarum TaxID=34480 RepID=A0ABR2WQU7_9FUNG
MSLVSNLNIPYVSRISSPPGRPIHPKHRLDLYVPQESESTSPDLLVFFHGGAWRSNDKLEFNDFARNLVKIGGGKFAVAVVNYPLTTTVENPSDPAAAGCEVPHYEPETYMFKTLEDSAKAIAFLANHGDVYGYNEKRIILVGHSVGAQLISMLLLEPKYFTAVMDNTTYVENPSTKVVGIIGIDGIYDIPKLVLDYPNYQNWFVAAACSQDHEKWKRYSPQYQTPSNLPQIPVLIIHSPEDELVNDKQAISFKQKLQELGLTNVSLETDVSGKHDETLATVEVAQKVINFCGSL